MRRSRRCSTPTASRASAPPASSSTASTPRTRGIDVVATYRCGSPASATGRSPPPIITTRPRSTERINALGPLATIPGIVLFGRGRGHSLHRRPAARQDRVQRRRRDRHFRPVRADHPLRQGVLAGRGSADRQPDQPHRLRPRRHLPGGQMDHRPRASRQGVRHALELAVGANNLFDVYPDPLAVRAAAGVVGGVYPINQNSSPFRASRRSASTAASSTAAPRSSSEACLVLGVPLPGRRRASQREDYDRWLDGERRRTPARRRSQFRAG